MPLVRKIDKNLWEVRSHLRGRIAQVLFTTAEGRMILLHGLIKIPEDIARGFATDEDSIASAIVTL